MDERLAAAFHDVTADAAQQSAREMENADSEFGNKLNELGNGPVNRQLPGRVNRKCPGPAAARLR